MSAVAGHEPVFEGFTVEMAEDLLPDGVRYELHGGQILVLSPAARWHVRVQRRIANLLERQGRNADLEIGMQIAPRETRVLDVAVLVADAGEEPAYFRPGEIELGVEVVSPSSRDTDYVDKPHLYAQLGIAEFWRVDRAEKDVVYVSMFRLDRERCVYDLIETVTLDELERR
jgi:Uma2 family endonuclease